MAWTLTPFSLVVFGSAILALWVGVAALRQRPDPLAWPLAVAMIAVGAWAIPHAISFGARSVGQVAFWHRLMYPGVVTAPSAYLVLTVIYAGHERWLTRRTYGLLAIVPVITVVLVWTNPLHHLYWESLSVVRFNGASILVEEFGPWYWVTLGYLYLVTIVSLVGLAAVVIRSGPLYRKQSVLMFVGGFVPLATNGAFNFDLIPGPPIDLTTMALAVSGVTFALALYYFDLLEIRPVARDRLVEELDDGVLVVGPNGLIQDFNPTAATVLDGIKIDQPAEEVLPATVSPDGGELMGTIGGEERRFRTRSTELTDHRGREIGRIVYLNDITDLVEREQRISVLNRILRHNIRNELNVVAGRLDMLRAETEGSTLAHAETAAESTRRVIDFAEKARHVERTLRERDSSVVVSAEAVAERVVAELREVHPDAAIDGESSADDTRVEVVDDDLLAMAISELVENAIVHADQPSPTVTVRIERANGQISIAVADTGPGVPKQEREISTAQVETQLEHGGGLGLWLVRWTVALSGGDLTFADNEPTGSVVTLSLPAAE